MSDTTVTHKLKLLQKQFLCCVPINNIEWLNIFDDFKWDEQQALINFTVNSELVLKYPIKITYQKSFLKFIIQRLEEKESEIHDDLYAAFGRVVALGDSKDCFKHYCVNGGKIITLKENPNIISEGTTGLCSWQASLALAEWCITNKSRLMNRTILELGSGVGLTGITVALNCEPKKMILSDCHESVLQVLCSNVLINLNKFGKEVKLNERILLTETIETSNDTIIEVLNLPWEEITEKSWEFANPDLLLAADVIYDSSLFPSLINALSCFLRRQNTKELIIACTVRNENTLEEFLRLLVNQGLRYNEIELVPQNNFIWSTACPIKIFCVNIKQPS